MARIIMRGRDKYRAQIARLPLEQQPIGGASINVVLRKDFLFHAATCLDHVELNGITLYILCENGDLCALLSPFGSVGKR